MPLHEVNAPKADPTDDYPRCVFCDEQTARREAIFVRQRPICHGCTGDLLAQLAADFRQTPTRIE
jgi:formylmethanofuran dehydrogenase subunit E